ncbi:ATP-dependent DNA helicase RecQ [Colletotrichum aenigma]|uniref:ATP-dependent DNA helicase RecQ n=1 Tax=Colletotrichum aenigma TaxID=1215731 RepID=UPI001872BAD0|nr:ATP-dependent DNA helicase RecQ [Colletotrichum aenigma]KAF5522946.1 ATP-dependent DNA helicase RecQ [Colletotrichum aenigma]
MDDDFGFDSADEADLLAVADGVPPSTKRAPDDGDDAIEEPASKKHRSGSQTSELAQKVLRERFDLNAFRLEQEAAISRIIGGESAVVVFPTGGGKSLCYQVPAVAIKELDRQTNSRSPEESGVTVVISPLIALMKDQVDALRRRGISAAVLDSTQTRETFVDIHQKLSCGKLDLLYCAPERLNNEGFLASLQAIRGGIRLLAIDEAHCISEWGHSFRPDYLKIARFAKEANVERVVCLTATATAAVAKDIRDTFNIPPEGLFVTSMYRSKFVPVWFISLRSKSNTSSLNLCVQAINEKDDQVKICTSFLKEHPGPSIIYVTTHAGTESLSKSLVAKGFKAKPYHAGLDKDVRSDIQDKFLRSTDMIIVGTIAFGMGIDKENVRTIIHFDLPSSIEAYSQQIGRAGRDGKPSTCMLYLSDKDFFLRNVLVHGERPSRLALRALFEEICDEEHCRLSPGETFSVGITMQSKRVDIKETQLSIIYAYLELKFGLLRAGTPQYSEYKYQVLQRQEYNDDDTPAAKAIRRGSRTAKIWTFIEIDDVADGKHLYRGDITRKLDHWAESGVVKLQKSGVQNVFRLKKALPKSQPEIDAMIDNIDQEIIKKEKQDLQRVQDLVNLLTGTKCITRALAAYFADTTHASVEECGHCTWCETHKQVVLPEFKPKPLDKDLMKSIASVCKALCSDEARKAKSSKTPSATKQALANSTAKNDPRFMACVAFGIKTPRISSMQLWKNEAVFERMSDCDFDELVAAFEKMIK